jgi:very-short-patch-repair endonuclease
MKLNGEWDYPIYFGAGPDLFRLAGELRKSMTPAEKILWEQLRRKQLKGMRFRRQHPLKNFIVDFFCYDAMLVIEIDVEVHNGEFHSERDEQRTIILHQLGIREIRFRNEEVLQNLDSVLRKIHINLE